MLPRLLATCLVALASQACFFYISTAPGAPANIVIILTPGTWVLTVDRAWSAIPGTASYPMFPASALRESDYRATAGPRYSVLVGTESQSVSIAGSPSIKGTRAEQSDEQVSYALNEGLLAGGRLVVWKSGEGYQAELTVYGSGVPIVKSERGSFVRPGG